MEPDVTKIHNEKHFFYESNVFVHHTDKKKKKLAYLEKIKFVTKIMTYLEIQSNLQQVKLHNRFNESFEPISRFVHCVSMICYNVVSFWCAEYHKPSP